MKTLSQSAITIMEHDIHPTHHSDCRGPRSSFQHFEGTKNSQIRDICQQIKQSDKEQSNTDRSWEISGE